MAKKTSKLSLKVYKSLVNNGGPMKPDQIASILEINTRSVRYALNILHTKKLVSKLPDMEDLRTNYYFPKQEKFSLAEITAVVAEA
ncbi:MAG: hypothetical protein ACXAC7_14350 [Candidatus Hodarchaeales archaeon]|jgi:predicted transcriptional regulator